MRKLAGSFFNRHAVTDCTLQTILLYVLKKMVEPCTLERARNSLNTKDGNIHV
jgi:hypothetical protein